MNVTPYTKYKYSGVEWLGNVREAAVKLPDESDAGDVMPDSDADDALDSDMTSDEIIELDMVAEPDPEY